MSHPQSMQAPEPPGAETIGAAATEGRSLTAHEAANFLHVSPETLRTWEQEFGFPVSLSEHSASNYRFSDLLALQDALPDALSITAAIYAARRGLAAQEAESLPPA